LIDTYGLALAELVVQKKKEVETWCPSGAYPTPVSSSISSSISSISSSSSSSTSEVLVNRSGSGSRL